jgi:hypothetical protein
MESELSGLRADQLAGLLKVHADDAVPWLTDGSRSAGDLLRARLDEPVPLDPSRSDSVPAVLRRPCEALRPYGSLADLLTDPAADVAALRLVKDYAKTLARHSRCPAAEAVTITLYYAAIAAALVHHGVRITRHTFAGLEGYLGQLRHKDWMPDALKDLFRRAERTCRQPPHSNGTETAG